MNELSRANKWLYSKLAADAMISSIVGTRIYARKAPPNAAYPFIVFNYQAGTDSQGMGTARVLTRSLYQVKVICKNSPDENVYTVADRIDELIGQGVHELQGDMRISSRREEPLELLEDTPNSAQFYYHLGGLYRLHIHEA
jgi:hypothetical protein